MRAIAFFSALALASFTSSALAQEVESPTQFTAVSALDSAVVGKVDVQRYAGLWYEIASIPLSFQGFCQKTTAEYAVIAPNKISVANKCKVGFVPVEIFGEATVVDEDTNAILEVSFDFVSKKGDYRIIALAEDYTYALVTNAKRASLFVLSREKTLDDAIYSKLLKRAFDVGVDVSKVRMTQQ